jgi:hypothetical protein
VTAAASTDQAAAVTNMPARLRLHSQQQQRLARFQGSSQGETKSRNGDDLK